MKWPGPLITKAVFLKRYKRFLADFELPNGELVTAHCANTGSMVTCQQANAPAWLTHHDNPKRKLAYSWQAIRMPDGWVGINTGLANHLVREAIENGVISELAGYERLQTERKYGVNSRIDLLLSGEDKADCYVEVKNVTLLDEAGVASFPDAVTQRGYKHLGELAAVARAGGRAVLLYCVQRESARKVVPASNYDPAYTAKLAEVMAQGVEVYAYRAAFSEDGIQLRERLPFEF